MKELGVHGSGNRGMASVSLSLETNPFSTEDVRTKSFDALKNAS